MIEDRSSEATTPFGEDVSRRKLLKILAASGTAVAASAVLPGKWMKPIVSMGVLPAHAQQSGVFSVGNLRASRGSVILNFNFIDPLKGVDGDTYCGVWYRGGTCGNTPNFWGNQTINAWGATLGGTPGRGKVSKLTMTGVSGCGEPICDVEAQVQLFTGGRESIASNWAKVPDDPGCTASTPD